MEKYLDVLRMLSWKESPEIQNNAIEYLSGVEDWDFRNCIINTPKDVWENILKVIKNNKSIDMHLILQDLLFLLKDLTWPGALDAFDIIKKMGKEEIYLDLTKALAKANREKDEMWIDNLKLLLIHLNSL